jgi:hypothetical protein
MQLNWPTQQQTQPPPVYQQPQQQWNYGYRQPRKEPKKTSSWLIGCLGLIGVAFLIYIIGGANFAPREPVSTVEPPPKYIKQYENRQPPTRTALGTQVHLSNNPDAKDVSFAELKSFIREDTTDEGLYLEGVRDCVDFAEQLHNNAERAGIEAAFVTVNFAGEEIGHAMNVFKTTDMGLVYIDCTGRGFSAYEQRPYGKLDPCERDRVAYVEKGGEYGVIDINKINKVESLNYTFYIEFAQNWQKFASMMDAYTNEVDAFNQAYANKTTLPTSEYSKYKDWKAQLEGKERILEELQKKLGNCFAKPLGIVETVKIYW